MHGLVMFSTRDVSDEELLLNYRFNPKAIGLPSWYHPVMDGEDDMRWDDHNK